MTILMATNNAHKIKEIKEIFADTDYTVVSPKELGIKIDVEEDGTTFAENSLKKAQGFCNATGLIAIADDSGLVVDALDGQPGVYSARYGGDGLDDAGRTDLLIKNMEGITNRAAAFECAISMVYPDGKVITASGRCEGNIALAPSTRVGFGYDPVFIPNGYDVTFSELTMDEKNSISHRGRALAELKKKLNGESK
ncbi:MAG: XTP/dITP diphosphatase [Clostridiales bacterium]|nr:XTP/dITP diphosphatase [Clostridiales bacterium]